MTTLEFFRQFRIGPFTVFDTVLSYIAAYYLAPFLSFVFKKIGILIPRITWMLWVVPISVLAHQLIRQKTPLLSLVSESQNFFAIATVIFLTIAGLSKIRIINKPLQKKK